MRTSAKKVIRRRPLSRGLDTAVTLPNNALGDSDAIVRVDACGICRSDWHLWQEDWSWVGLTLPLPCVMGHEVGARSGLLSMVASGAFRPERIVEQTVDVGTVNDALNRMTAYKTNGFNVITSWKASAKPAASATAHA